MKTFKNISMLIIALIFLLPNFASAEEIIIFHTNDTHGRILNTDEKGKSIGWAEIVAAVKTAKAESKNTFWFDAGDTFQGLPRVNISKGENMLPLLNAAGIDLMVPGNHEFDYGLNQLKKLEKKLKFPVITANISLKSNGATLFPPYKIFKRGNIKIGVFGLTTPETLTSASPENIAALNFLNPVETAQEMIKILRPQCDILIAVTHMGIDKNSEFTSKRIAAETEGIDLIIDGHSHTELPQGLTVGKTLIVQTGSFTRKLGRVTLNLSEGKIISKKAELLTAEDVKKINPTPDKKITNQVIKLENKNKKFFSEVVAHSDKPIAGDREIVRHEETEIGNFCADALRWKSGADFAVINGGGIRAGLPAGDITRQNILEVAPYPNIIQKAEIDGKTIHAMLEHSVSAYPEELGGFLSISGLNFSFDPSQPAGQRVQDIFIGGEILDENKIYTMGTVDFLLIGGDGYKMLKNSKVIGQFGTIYEVLVEYIKYNGASNIDFGRIKILDATEERKAA